jgi:hypothetical protein
MGKQHPLLLASFPYSAVDVILQQQLSSEETSHLMRLVLLQHVTVIRIVNAILKAENAVKELQNRNSSFFVEFVIR